MSDAGVSSEPRKLSDKPMAIYMRQRRLAKLVGLTVKQWINAGYPTSAVNDHVDTSEAREEVLATPVSTEVGSSILDATTGPQS